MPAFPTFFLSHGTPDLVLQPSPAREFLESFASELGKPQAIIIMSSHFDMRMPSFGADEHPGMLHEFDAGDTDLSRKVYAAPGFPELATVAANLVEQAGFPVQEITGRGFDYGAWGPLSLLYPQADIPVVPMAVQGAEGAGHHLVLGRALAPLRQHGVLIISSGNLNKPKEQGEIADAVATPGIVAAFQEWVREKVEAGAVDDIADYRALAPHAKENHPKPEHFLPLLFAMGAAGEGSKGRRVHSSVQRATSVMDAYVFA